MTHENTDTLPADTPTTDQIATTFTQVHRDADPGEGVNAMSRKSSRKRAWDAMSETDRQVLLETVRQHREAQAAKDALQLQMMTQRPYR